jgi:hypothetical protein
VQTTITITIRREPRKNCLICDGTGEFISDYDCLDMPLPEACACTNPKSRTLTFDEALDLMCGAVHKNVALLSRDYLRAALESILPEVK